MKEADLLTKKETTANWANLLNVGSDLRSTASAIFRVGVLLRSLVLNVVQIDRGLGNVVVVYDRDRLPNRQLTPSPERRSVRYSLRCAPIQNEDDENGTGLRFIAIIPGRA
jgi:hypothetical protein